MRIRSKILVLIFVIVLITGGVSTLIGRTLSMNTVKDEMSDHLVSTAQSRVHHIKTVLGHHIDSIELYTKQIRLILQGSTKSVEGDIPTFSFVVSGVVNGAKDFDRALILDEHGTVLISSDPQLFPLGTDLSASQALLKAQKGTYVGESDIGESNGKFVLCTAAPLALDSEGSHMGTLVFLGGEDGLFEITTDSTGLGKTGEVYIVNEDGYMLTPSRFEGEEAILTRKVDLSSIQPYLEETGGSQAGGDEWEVISSTNYMDSKVFGVYSYLPELGWTVVVEKGASEAYAPVSSLTRTMLWSLFAILLLGTLASILISRALSNPILRLHRGAEEIMNGNWDYDVSTSARDEIGALSRAFSKMTANLKKSHEELKEYSEGLEIKVEERTRELATANEDLSKEVAERKQVQESLARSESYFRSLIENAPDMIIVLNADATLRYVSPSAVRLHGLPLEEAVGKSCFDWIHPDDLPRVAELFERAVQDPGYTATLNLRARSKDGSWRSFELVGQNFLNDPAVKGIVINYHDITERKQAEEALQKAHDELEIRVRDRTAQLANANEVLQEEIRERQKAEDQIKASLKEKEVLLKEIHHRVKNNLQVISSLLNLQAANLTDESTLVMFKESQNRVKSMALIHERLYQSKDLAKVDFAEYLQNLANHLFRTYSANSSGIELKMEVKNVSLSIDSAVPCGLIVNELLTNALKYAFPVGVGAREGEAKAEICIGFSSDNGRYTLEVSDNGVGLPGGLDLMNTDSLGMQLVFTLTDQLGGTIEIEREGGTTFKITFSEPDLGKGA